MRQLTPAFVAMVAIMIVGFPTSSWAWNCDFESDCGCRTWYGDPNFEIENSANDYDTAAKQDSITDIIDRIGPVNDVWLDPTWSLDAGSGLSNGESEIWLSISISSPGLTSTITGTGDRDCNYQEANIRMNAYEDWIWDTPSTYYDPDTSEDDGDSYIRPIHLHEFLHAIGIDHEDDEFGYSNYWDKWGGAFTNRIDYKMVEPLPDDRKGLRALYPVTNGTELDLALLNYWRDLDDVVEGENGVRDAVMMHKLCAPSKGYWWDDEFADHCSTSDTTTGLCPGDYVKVRVAAANYGTSNQIYSVQMWLSTNTNLNTSYDLQSPTTTYHFLNYATSGIVKNQYQIPSSVSAGTTYHVIMRIVPKTGEESTQNNWIPLRGTISIGSGC